MTRKRQAERVRMLAILDRLGARVERDLRKEIARTMNRAAVFLSDNESTEQASAGHKERVKDILYPFYKRVAVVFIEDIYDKSKSANAPQIQKERTVEGLTSEFVTNWVEKFGAEAVVAVTRTTRNHIKAVTEEALRDGLSEINAAKRMREAARMFSVTRSRTIARTESHRAAMAAADNAAQELPGRFKKVWVSSGGPDTRDEHRDADDQERELNEPFLVWGERLRYPGDPSGSARNVINCRCVAVHEPR